MHMKKSLARWFLRRGGWRIEGERPPYDSFVLIAAPHTSNWDFPYMLAFATLFDIKISWLAKHSLFYPPMGWITRVLGGIPIERHKNSNVVAELVDLLKNDPKLVLAVPAEGTRSYSDYWKSGFYHIARGAGVPIVPSYLDYGQRRGGFGPALIPTDDVKADMDYLREFYGPMMGKHPELFSPIRLREEEVAKPSDNFQVVEKGVLPSAKDEK
jgi:1-acyl-sn-glycerol-3-phosphate acyltransferase